ncbi:MAG: type II secretion system GspH family protein [Cyanobacteria bacterium]|nr:type II secretion system GspH family protein [Cyanobacteriota bacterium]
MPKCGFTLIELGIVVALIAVMAAVAVPKLANTDEGSEGAVMKDMVSQLSTAASTYTLRTGNIPNDFSDYVTTAPLSESSSHYTLSTHDFGTQANGEGCMVIGAQIVCQEVFRSAESAKYDFNDGAITLTAGSLGL